LKAYISDPIRIIYTRVAPFQQIELNGYAKRRFATERFMGFQFCHIGVHMGGSTLNQWEKSWLSLFATSQLQS
jgi:hypothetical protein